MSFQAPDKWVPRVRYSDPVPSATVSCTGSEYRTRGTLGTPDGSSGRGGAR
jgi:hypothetical protein